VQWRGGGIFQFLTKPGGDVIYFLIARGRVDFGVRKVQFYEVLIKGLKIVLFGGADYSRDQDSKDWREFYRGRAQPKLERGKEGGILWGG